MSAERAVEKLISGGQTGVDRAALDLALERGLPCGGWCPRGRRAEDGRVPERYPLEETPEEDYEERTRRNVRDSDGTLVLTRGAPAGGTALTVRFAESSGKPWLVVDLTCAESAADRGFLVERTREWLAEYEISTLNVAGPRESEAAGVGEAARMFLGSLLGGEAD